MNRPVEPPLDPESATHREFARSPAESAAPGVSARRFAPGTDPRRKSPFVAGLLSVLPGLGQVYVGYYRRGLAHIVVFGVLLSLLASEFGGEAILPSIAVGMFFFYLYNIVDAARRASLLNLALDGIEQVEMPDDFRFGAWHLPGGSVFGGLLAIVVGGILFAHTRYGVSLDWVAEWWPLGLVLLGVYLVVRGIAERRAPADSDPENRAIPER